MKTRILLSLTLISATGISAEEKKGQPQKVEASTASSAISNAKHTEEIDSKKLTEKKPGENKPDDKKLQGPKSEDKAPKPEDLLKDSDRSRGSAAVAEGIRWEVKVDAVGDDGTSTITYDLKVKGSDALAEAIAPARNKGEVMLFNDRNIWFFKPGLKKPLSISPRQKLMGQAANGDIASTNYNRDYDGTVTGSEKVDGEDCWTMDLKAKAKNVTYDRIRYWVSKKERLGMKAEFLTVSGSVFKFATFEYKNKMLSDGKDIPFVSKMVITDALKKQNITTLTYNKPKPEKHADSIFNVNNLVR